MPPLYEYECAKCETKFEETKKVEERKDVKCPICQSEPPIVELLISRSDFILKGGGWAKDRYGK